MNRKNVAIFVSILIISFTGCKKINTDEPLLTPLEIDLSTAAPQAIESSNEFGIELFTRVSADEDDNFMISPLSASTALTMLLNGCDGDTYDQLKQALKYPQDMSIDDINEAYGSLVSQLLVADPKVKFALANAIFYRNGFTVKSPFLNTMAQDYEADIEGLDFQLPAALTVINKWASDNTMGKIPKVLDKLSADAVMFLMNALYFKGDWSYQFDKSLTSDRPFYSDAGVQVDVSTMTGEPGSKVAYGANYKAVELPYGRTNFTMLLVVPTGTLEEFNEAFTGQTWNSITTAIDVHDEYSKVKVYMPKFKFSFEKFLNSQLQAMGMIDAFNPQLADLSGIADESIFVSFVKQNTFVEVDEEGTEAAAVTTIGVEVTSMPPEPLQFVIDKPFVFAIRERTTNTLLFIGQVVNP